MDTSSVPAEGKKSNRTLLLLIGAVLLVCCCMAVVAGLGAAGYFVYTNAGQEIGPYEAPPADPSAGEPPVAEPSSPQVEWLATAAELESLSGNVGIVGWELYETTPGDFRVCNTFTGTSWAYYPNQATNCIYIMSEGAALDGVVKDFFESGQLFPDEKPVQSKVAIPYEHAVYVGTHSNAHTVIDMFVVDGGYLYWASVTIGTPAGASPIENYGYYADAIDDFLYRVIQLNMQKR